jgi:uncharacterized protein (TIGR02466 family)
MLPAMTGVPAPLALFAAPLYAVTVADAGEHKKGLRAAIERHREVVPLPTGSHRNAWRTTKALHKADDPHVAWLSARILELVSRALADQHEDWKHVVPGIEAMWANVGGFGAWLAPHNHHPRPWSGVYYVSGAPPPSPGEADRGGQIAFLHPNPVAQPRSVAYAPTDGLLFLFPGWLDHMVHPNLREDERVSVAFNIALLARGDSLPDR